MNTALVVDVVIAVHDPRRRVDRAVESLIDAGRRVRVTVVCHGIPADSVAPSLPAADNVRLVEFADGIPSPSGPFNHGLRLATAPYVMIMGSDDFTEPGALDAWIDAVQATGADILLAPLRFQNGALLANPLSRPWRRFGLDAVRDRLFHRTAPLGLIRRDLVTADGPLSEGMPVGGDLAWSSALWTSGRIISFDRTHPAYIIGADADERVTTSPRDMRTVLAPVDRLLQSPWAVQQPARVRASLVAKLLRVNILGALHARPAADSWPTDARASLAATIGSLEAYSTRGFEDLPRGDRALLDFAAASSSTAMDLEEAIARHRAAGRVERLVPRKITRVFGRESVLRRYARYAIARSSR
ncbi:glycosyltransferase [Microbacterium sp. NPDC055357]